MYSYGAIVAFEQVSTNVWYTEQHSINTIIKIVIQIRMLHVLILHFFLVLAPTANAQLLLTANVRSL